jgi:8-oxo-dGTP pyrophosphatase MutT (NUDIX family)
MIDPADRILLVRLEFTDWEGWVLPGGGLEAGEDHVTALHRELAEETGVPQMFVGPALWHRRHVRSGMIQGFDGQEERVFLVPCHAFEVAPGLPDHQLRAEGMVGHRWWTAAELAETDEVIRPVNLAQLVAQVLEFGAPPEPLVFDEIGP